MLRKIICCKIFKPTTHKVFSFCQLSYVTGHNCNILKSPVAEVPIFFLVQKEKQALYYQITRECLNVNMNASKIVRAQMSYTQKNIPIPYKQEEEFVLT